MAPAGDSTELLRRWHDEEDKEAREALVEQMLPLARGLARRYVNRGESLDDLEQVASVGLLKAIDRFDPGRAVQFATFAVPTISGEIKRHFRDRGWMVRVPRELQELNTRLVRAREALTRELGRSGATTERVVEAISAGETYRVMSLDEPLAEDGVPTLDVIGGCDANFERAEQRVLLHGGLERLPPREREILRLRFYEGLTQREIAEAVGISQMHVSRLIRRSIKILRATLAERVAEAA